MRTSRRVCKAQVGDRFGSLTVVRVVEKSELVNKKDGALVEARCDCGAVIRTRVRDLKKPIGGKCSSSRRCGACRLKALTKHGMSHLGGYVSWRCMMIRCYRTGHHSYKYYGGRGIRVVAKWHTFESFWADMGPTWKEGLTLERVNAYADYGPGNCTWIPKADQALNRRIPLKKYDTFLGPKTVRELHDFSGINAKTLRKRLDRGVHDERLLIRPAKKSAETPPEVQAI